MYSSMRKNIPQPVGEFCELLAIYFAALVLFENSFCIQIINIISQIIGPPKQDRIQSIKNKNNRSLSFHFDLFSGCRFVRFSRFSLTSHQLLDKTYIYAHYQNGFNE